MNYSAYQDQQSSQTLAEGIAEYYATNATYFKNRSLAPQASEFFRCHDVVHVVFGCDITLPDEAIVKVSSCFGTTEGFGVMKGYRLPESKEIYADLRLGEVIATTLQSLALIPRALWRCRQMRKRWCWDNFECYLAVPLDQLREEFGIRVAH